MIKINIKTGVFGAVMGGLLLTIALPNLDSLMPEQVKEGKGRIVIFDKEFNDNTVESALTLLERHGVSKDSDKRELIELTSPGGSVFAGKTLINAMVKSDTVDTSIPVFGASMAADTWVTGTRRYVMEDSMILFHGAHSGSYAGSQPILEKMLNVLVSDKFKDRVEIELSKPEPVNPMKLFGARESGPSIEDSDLSFALNTKADFDKIRSSYTSEKKERATVESLDEEQFSKKLLVIVKEKGYSVVLMQLTSTLEIIKAINETMLTHFDKIIKQSKGKWTRDKIRKELFNDFEKDMVFTGKQLYDMGIATHLGAPNEEDYSN